jgi:hypothetical protein
MSMPALVQQSLALAVRQRCWRQRRLRFAESRIAFGAHHLGQHKVTQRRLFGRTRRIDAHSKLPVALRHGPPGRIDEPGAAQMRAMTRMGEIVVEQRIGERIVVERIGIGVRRQGRGC